jgi:hypothetical protein
MPLSQLPNFLLALTRNPAPSLKFEWQAFETPALPTPAPLPHFSKADSQAKCKRGRQNTEITQARDITFLSNLDKIWTRVTPISTVSCTDMPNVPGKNYNLITYCLCSSFNLMFLKSKFP